MIEPLPAHKVLPQNLNMEAEERQESITHAHFDLVQV
jgi:hypothetical protein